MEASTRRLEHLHHTVSQPFTYYTVDVKTLNSPVQRKQIFTKRYYCRSSMGHLLSFILIFNKREMDCLGGFCGSCFSFGTGHFLWVCLFGFGVCFFCFALFVF